MNKNKSNLETHLYVCNIFMFTQSSIYSDDEYASHYKTLMVHTSLIAMNIINHDTVFKHET